MLNKKKNNKGFTLVELLVVIAIIAILAVVAVPSLMSNLEKAKVSKLEADYNVISTGVVTYYADKNEYPVVTSLVSNGGKTVASTVVSSSTGGSAGTRMDSYIAEVANPFKATYALNTREVTIDSAKVEVAEIEITGAKIKDAGVAKLINDLGADKVDTSVSGTIKIAVVGRYN